MDEDGCMTDSETESTGFWFFRDILGMKCRINATPIGTAKKSMKIQVFIHSNNFKIKNDELLELGRPYDHFNITSPKGFKSLYDILIDDAWDELTRARCTWLTDKVGFQKLPSTE
tara:strand:+ start:1923 stop:2267 length:345 start_codon:yes stop_codon:yes gene_type:complete